MPETSPYPEPLQRVLHHFSRLPGIGRRTAERLALALMSWKPQDVAQFAQELAALRDQVTRCPVCGNFSQDNAPCGICAAPERQRDIVCVVEQATQIVTFEKSGCFHGLYHVLNGKLAPLNGVGPDDLRIAELQQRVADGGIQELVIATTPDLEGEATAHYLAQLFENCNLTITRIAAGVPVGADLSFADAATLASALAGRRTFR
ncbi:MAG: recombination protein RecR [Victivallales bacterium]|nr:recombination protein RecR [Victivallales bacterium]